VLCHWATFPAVGCLLTLLIISCADVIPFVYFYFCFLYLLSLTQKYFPMSICWSVSPITVSHSNFLVSDSTFRFLIHFEWFFVMIRVGSSFIFLHVYIQFCQDHLLWRLSFHCLYPWCFCQKSVCGLIYVFSIQFLVSVLSFMPAPCRFGYYSLVLWFEVRHCDAFSFVIVLLDCLNYFSLL
jgi:hypothetical protein